MKTRVHFGESLVLDYTQKSTISILAVKLTVSAIIYPRWTATVCQTVCLCVYRTLVAKLTNVWSQISARGSSGFIAH